MYTVRFGLPRSTRIGSGLLLLLGLTVAPLRAQQSSPPTEESRFITRGRMFASLSFSLDQRNAENENQLLREVVDQDRTRFRVTGSAGYAFRDNVAFGLGLSYGREREDITFLDQDDTAITSKLVGQDLSLVPNLRVYVPVAEGAFQIFVRTDLRLTVGEALERRFLPDDIEKIERESLEANLGVRPGALLFFGRHWALETSVDLAGLTSRYTRETVNDDEANRTRIVENAIDFSVNLLSLNLAVAYYF